MPYKDQILTYIVYMVIAVAVIFVGVYLYLNYSSLINRIIAPKTNQQDNFTPPMLGFLTGRIVAIDNSVLKINIGDNQKQDIKEIRINNQTLINKMFVSSGELTAGSLADFKIDRQANIELIPNEWTAAKINILIQNVIMGKVVSITKDEITITGSSPYERNIKLISNAIGANIKKGDSVIIFLKSGIDESPLEAVNIIIQK